MLKKDLPNNSYNISQDTNTTTRSSLQGLSSVMYNIVNLEDVPLC